MACLTFYVLRLKEDGRYWSGVCRAFTDDLANAKRFHKHLAPVWLDESRHELIKLRQ
jgi:hypothetical protein